MIIHRLQPLFSEDIRESLGNASVSVQHRDYMQTFQIVLEIFTFALNPFQGASAFFNAVSPLPVDVHGSLLAQTCYRKQGWRSGAIASNRCGSGSTPGPGVTCGLSLLLVLYSALSVFLGVLRFSSLHKNQHF